MNLLERYRRGVRVTPAGEALARHARSILSEFEGMRGELRAFAADRKGRIRLLSNTLAMGAPLPAQLCQCLELHQDYSIDLEEQPADAIVRALEERQADLGIVADAANFGTLQKYLIASSPIVVVVSPSHRLAKFPNVAFVDIIDEPIVGILDKALELLLAKRAPRSERHLNYRIQLNDAKQVALHVEAGIGISILPEVIARELHRDLTILPLSENCAIRHVYLCASDLCELAPHVAWLAQQLSQPIPQ